MVHDQAGPAAAGEGSGGQRITRAAGLEQAAVVARRVSRTSLRRARAAKTRGERQTGARQGFVEIHCPLGLRRARTAGRREADREDTATRPQNRTPPVEHQAAPPARSGTDRTDGTGLERARAQWRAPAPIVRQDAFRQEDSMDEREPATGACAPTSAVPAPSRRRGPRRSCSLQQAEVLWLSTVRPSGQPHVTPLLAVWWNGAIHFCTGPTERKAKNPAANPACVLTTGRAELEGLDIVIEGRAVIVTDPSEFSGATWLPPTRASTGPTSRPLTAPGRGSAMPCATWERLGVPGRARHGVRLRQGRALQPNALAIRLSCASDGRGLRDRSG